MKLSFLNSNWYRKYPLQSTAGMDGFPDDLIVGCRIMYTDPVVYISKVTTNNNFISIEFHNNSTVIGTAQGTVSLDAITLSIVPIDTNLSGFIIIGNIDSTVANSTYSFDSTTGALEPSVITIFTPPGVTNITTSTNTLTGNILIDPTNLTMTVDSNSIELDVIAPTDISSRMDRTANLLTCLNPIISGINSVVPLLKDGNWNIDIYGIAPIQITSIAGKITVGTNGVSLPNICNQTNIPPLDETSDYHGDIMTVDSPEWQSWPQYN